VARQSEPVHYVDPIPVDSPRANWKLKEVIMNTGQGGWSVAHGFWDEVPVVGVRWNGSDSDTGQGNPQSRGHATWFILPDGLKKSVLDEVDRLIEEGESVICKITKREDYDFGAWRIEVTLKKKTRDSIVFSLPKLPERLCRGDKGYIKPVGNELCGIFLDEKWFGDLYSNGIAEDKNTTEIEVFRDVLIRNVKNSLRSHIK
jgi:hypothetical protein